MLKKYLFSNNIKKRCINLSNSYKTFILSTFFLFTLTILVAQNNTNKSPALETLIQQIDENYVPAGWNDTMNSMEKLAGNIPQIYFTFLGTAMNKQKPYINNKPIASKNYKNLNQEILFLIPDIVDLKNSLNSNNDQPINDNTLGDIYNDALIGIINETFNQEYKKNTGKDLSQISMPSVLDQHIVGGTSFRKVAKKDKNEINLFGEVAPHADTFPSGHKDKKKWDPSKSFSSDIIIGTWYSDPLCTKSEITFAKGPKGYTARRENKYSYTLWEVRRVKGDWDQPEKKMYWNEYYIATRWFISKTEGSKKRISDMSFYIKPYRDTMVLQDMSKSYSGYDWEVYKPF